jgi:hypothetical protein
MNGTELGTCQGIFASSGYDVEVDLLLSGPATVEGYPLMPGSPFSPSLVPPDEPWARRRMLRLRRDWADNATECHASIVFADEVTTLTVRSGRETVCGELLMGLAQMGHCRSAAARPQWTWGPSRLGV